MSEELQTSNEALPDTEEITQPEAEPQEDELVKAKEALAQLEDKHLRLMAEYDNYRRRVAKEKESIYADAYADILKAILPVVDNLERALQYQEGAQLAQGVQMTYTQFTEAMKQLGVEVIETQTFDPTVHNAVMHVEDDSLAENTIVEVFQKGYKKGERVLRFAMVKVAN